MAVQNGKYFQILAKPTTALRTSRVSLHQLNCQVKGSLERQRKLRRDNNYNKWQYRVAGRYSIN